MTDKQIFVALLRGINVGGNNKIDMKTLKTAFEKAGLENVKTYINSGNIVFSSSKESLSSLPVLLEKAIKKEFGLSIYVLVRDLPGIKKVMTKLPDDWTNDKEQKSDVLFLWDDVNNKSVVGELPVREGVDTAFFVPGAVLWNVARKNQTKSGLVKLVGTKLYKQMTVRNVNTTRKIYTMMSEIKNS